jgi:hypothetical protein
MSDPLAALVAHIGLTTKTDLLDISEATLRDIMIELTLDAAARARVEREIALIRRSRPPVTDPLATHFEKAELRSHEPWRVFGSGLELRAQRYIALPESDQRAAFLNAAKNGALTPQECMLGTYLFFGAADDQSFLRGVLCNEHPADRLVAHNFYVARKLGEAFYAQHGAQLRDLEWPLFPPVHEFVPLNQLLLRETRDQPTGGAPRRVPSCFAKALQADPSSDIIGGGWLPMSQNERGAGVDTTPLENWILGLVGRNKPRQQREGTNPRGRRNPRGGEAEDGWQQPPPYNGPHPTAPPAQKPKTQGF